MDEEDIATKQDCDWKCRKEESREELSQCNVDVNVSVPVSVSINHTQHLTCVLSHEHYGLVWYARHIIH